MAPPEKTRSGCGVILVALPCLVGALVLSFVTFYLATFPGCPPDFHQQNMLEWGVTGIWIAYAIAVTGVVVGVRKGFGGRSAPWTVLAILAAVAALLVPLLAGPYYLPMC